MSLAYRGELVPHVLFTVHLVNRALLYKGDMVQLYYINWPLDAQYEDMLTSKYTTLTMNLFNHDLWHKYGKFLEFREKA